MYQCLSPCRESGLKSICYNFLIILSTSLPLSGEWIEITDKDNAIFSFKSLPLSGEWIEIYSWYKLYLDHTRLSPCWESGLKFQWMISEYGSVYVSPLVGRVDWNISCYLNNIYCNVSPLVGRVDWNLDGTQYRIYGTRLSPCRESGLKLRMVKRKLVTLYVSPLVGRVDWNHLLLFLYQMKHLVSPLVGRVDWNP